MNNEVWYISCIFILISIVVFVKLHKISQLPKLFQQASTKRLLKYYDELFQNTLDNTKIKRFNEVMRCTHQASVLCYYGEYEEAERIMATIDKYTLSSGLRAQCLYVSMLLSCFRDHDFGGAGNLCIAIVHMNQQNNEEIIEWKMDTQQEELLLNMAKILRGQSSEEAIDYLEEIFNKIRSKSRHIEKQLLVAWLLAYAYDKKGNLQKSEERLSFCMLKAPYCIVLHHLR